MLLGILGVVALWVCAISSVLTIGAYALSLFRPAYKKPILLGRVFYTITAFALITAFGLLAAIVYARTVGGVYRYSYVFEHTGSDVKDFYRLAATWSGQEGSFLLWAFWTSLLGFLVFWKAGKYEARVMPFFVSVLTFLAAILIKQSPFALIPPPPPGGMYPPEGLGLSPSLQNYWMTIHPPTIFFGFASLAVPFCYAVAALIWKDYKDWTARVMPYALLSCLTLGIGLCMGGYWAYETQGWHGFWGWDPVENASFFPWLCVTALVHGLIVQKDRGGMARTNAFLCLFGFWLFLVGTFLTRSGALSGKDKDGAELSIHAFANIGSSGLVLMVSMLIGYGVLGLGLWIYRMRSMPSTKTLGDSPVSRDFAFFLNVLLLVAACVIVALGTTQPLFQGWMHKPVAALKPVFYNRFLLPLGIVAAFLMGCVPWLAWRTTNTEKFLRKMMIPWFVMLAFGFFMLFWIIGAQADMEKIRQIAEAYQDPTYTDKMTAWINPAVQRVAVMSLTSLGFLAALSNSMLAFKVFRSKKKLAAGGWIAHVGIGLMMIGIVVSNTFERTQRIEIRSSGEPTESFGYKFAFERMTGKPFEAYPLNPEYDRSNSVDVRVTPPDADKLPANEQHTFLISPRWFVHNLSRASSETKLERMRWPLITKYLSHDLYVGFASDPQYAWPSDPGREAPGIDFVKGKPRQLGKYSIMYVDNMVQPAKLISATLLIKTPDGKVVTANPKIEMHPGSEGMESSNRDIAIPEIKDENGNPSVAILHGINADSGVATFYLSLPEMKGSWSVPLEVTYKPWVNLVWVGIITMGLGILMALINRVLMARKVVDGPFGTSAPEPAFDDWNLDSAASSAAAASDNLDVPLQSEKTAHTIPKPRPKKRG